MWLEESYAKWQVQSVTVPRYTHFPPQTNLTEIIDKTEILEEGIADFFNPRDDEEEENLISGTTANGTKVQSSYIEKKTPAHGNASKGSETPITEGGATPGSGKRKAAENAMNKLHNEIMPDVMAWQKEKNRKRIPEEPQIADKKRKVENIESEEKENIETVTKKPKKDVETDVSRIILLVTGAPDDLTGPSAIKVSVLYAFLISETISTGHSSYV